MKKILFSAAAIILLSAAFLFIRSNARYDADNGSISDTGMTIKLGERSFKAIISDDPVSRARGLSGRESLGGDQAMLFAFTNPGLWGIWMKDMRFSIDIVWLDAGLKVVSLERRVSPETYPNIFFPESASLYVIELPAGTIGEIGLSKGDSADFLGGMPVGK